MRLRYYQLLSFMLLTVVFYCGYSSVKMTPTSSDTGHGVDDNNEKSSDNSRTLKNSQTASNSQEASNYNNESSDEDDSDQLKDSNIDDNVKSEKTEGTSRNLSEERFDNDDDADISAIIEKDNNKYINMTFLAQYDSVNDNFNDNNNEKINDICENDANVKENDVRNQGIRVYNEFINGTVVSNGNEKAPCYGIEDGFGEMVIPNSKSYNRRKKIGVEYGMMTHSMPCCSESIGSNVCVALRSKQPYHFRSKCRNDADFAMLQCCHTCRTNMVELGRDLFAQGTKSRHCFDRHNHKFCAQFVHEGGLWSANQQRQVGCNGESASLAFRICRRACGFCNTSLYSEENVSTRCYPPPKLPLSSSSSSTSAPSSANSRSRGTASNLKPIRSTTAWIERSKSMLTNMKASSNLPPSRATASQTLATTPNTVSSGKNGMFIAIRISTSKPVQPTQTTTVVPWWYTTTMAASSWTLQPETVDETRGGVWPIVPDWSAYTKGAPSRPPPPTWPPHWTNPTPPPLPPLPELPPIRRVIDVYERPEAPYDPYEAYRRSGVPDAKPWYQTWRRASYWWTRPAITSWSTVVTVDPLSYYWTTTAPPPYALPYPPYLSE